MPEVTTEISMENLVDVEAIRTLKACYFRNMDQRNWVAMEDVFTDDAFMDMHSEMAELARVGMPVDPTGGRMEGKAAILQAMSGALVGTATVHHGHMGEITINSESEATGIWPMEDIIVMPAGSPINRLRGYGHYHEKYRKEADGAWRIAHLRLSRLLIELT